MGTSWGMPSRSHSPALEAGREERGQIWGLARYQTSPYKCQSLNSLRPPRGCYDSQFTRSTQKTRKWSGCASLGPGGINSPTSGSVDGGRGHSLALVSRTSFSHRWKQFWKVWKGVSREGEGLGLTKLEPSWWLSFVGQFIIGGVNERVGCISRVF